MVRSSDAGCSSSTEHTDSPIGRWSSSSHRLAGTADTQDVGICQALVEYQLDEGETLRKHVQ